MKEVLWILIWSVGWIPGFMFGLWFEERKRRSRLKKRKRNFVRSVEDAGRRLMREDRIRSILNEAVVVERVKPVRKACGVFSSEEAQKILEV